MRTGRGDYVAEYPTALLVDLGTHQNVNQTTNTTVPKSNFIILNNNNIIYQFSKRDLAC